MIDSVKETIDACIENLRSEGMKDSIIAGHLEAAATYLRSKKWDSFYCTPEEVGA